MKMKKVKVAFAVVAAGSIVLFWGLLHSLGVFAHKVKKEFRKITAEEARIFLEEKKEGIIYCGQDSCGACRSFEPILKEAAVEEGLDILYLDADIIANQKEVLKYGIEETPTLIVIKEGEVDFYRGTFEKEEIVKILSKQPSQKERFSEIREITRKEVDLKKETNTDFFLYIGRDDCRDCQEFFPMLKDYVLNNQNRGVFYLDIKTIRQLAVADGAKQTDVDTYENLKSEFGITWVPLLLHIKNGVIVGRYEYLDEAYYQLNEGQQKERKQEFTEEFYHWMDREFGTE